MTPGEVKGYVLQVLKRKELTPEEKEAVEQLLQGFELIMKVAPVINKARKGLEDAKTIDSGDTSVDNDSEPETDPNTGW